MSQMPPPLPEQNQNPYPADAASGGGSLPPTMPGALERHSQSSWPTVIGILMLVFGGFAVLIGIWGIVAVFIQDWAVSFQAALDEATADKLSSMYDRWMPWQLLVGVIGLAVSVLAVMAGIGLLKRKGWGARSTRWWAWAKIGYAAVTSVMTVLISQEQFQIIAQSPNGAGAGMMGDFAWVTGVIMFIWLIALPIVILVVLAEKQRRAEIATWS